MQESSSLPLSTRMGNLSLAGLDKVGGLSAYIFAISAGFATAGNYARWMFIKNQPGSIPASIFHVITTAAFFIAGAYMNNILVENTGAWLRGIFTWIGRGCPAQINIEDGNEPKQISRGAIIGGLAPSGMAAASLACIAYEGTYSLMMLFKKDNGEEHTVLESAACALAYIVYVANCISMTFPFFSVLAKWYKAMSAAETGSSIRGLLSPWYKGFMNMINLMLIGAGIYGTYKYAYELKRADHYRDVADMYLVSVDGCDEYHYPSYTLALAQVVVSGLVDFIFSVDKYVGTVGDLVKDMTWSKLCSIFFWMRLINVIGNGIVAYLGLNADGCNNNPIAGVLSFLGGCFISYIAFHGLDKGPELLFHEMSDSNSPGPGADGQSVIVSGSPTRSSRDLVGLFKRQESTELPAARTPTPFCCIL